MFLSSLFGNRRGCSESIQNKKHVYIECFKMSFQLISAGDDVDTNKVREYYRAYKEPCGAKRGAVLP